MRDAEIDIEFEFVAECPKCKTTVVVKNMFKPVICPNCGCTFLSRVIKARTKMPNPSFKNVRIGVIDEN